MHKPPKAKNLTTESLIWLDEPNFTNCMLVFLKKIMYKNIIRGHLNGQFINRYACQIGILISVLAQSYYDHPLHKGFLSLITVKRRRRRRRSKWKTSLSWIIGQVSFWTFILLKLINFRPIIVSYIAILFHIDYSMYSYHKILLEGDHLFTLEQIKLALLDGKIRSKKHEFCLKKYFGADFIFPTSPLQKFFWDAKFISSQKPTLELTFALFILKWVKNFNWFLYHLCSWFLIIAIFVLFSYSKRLL